MTVILSTAEELRVRARDCADAVAKETDPEQRRVLERRARVLTRLADRVERDQRIADFIDQENIERYRRLLVGASGAARQRIERLLAECEARDARQSRANRLDQAHRWRMKAEECRAVVDQMTLPFARRSYLQLAENYEAMAAREEARVSGQKHMQAKAE